MIGNIRKMKTYYREEEAIRYELPLGDELIPMNDYLGKSLSLEFQGEINCTSCGRKTKKSFSQGYCYPCFISLPETDMCMVRPETCHYDKGTCRDPKWGEKNCMIPHTVYLANSSGVKVGITRKYHRMHRWMDQGAVEALPLLTVFKRSDAGTIEHALKAHVSDKTNWRKMLKGDVESIDLKARAEELMEFVPDTVRYDLEEGVGTIQIKYPVLEHPEKIKSLNFDKEPLVSGTLMGLKAQYLIFDTGVINIRKFGGYKISLK